MRSWQGEAAKKYNKRYNNTSKKCGALPVCSQVCGETPYQRRHPCGGRLVLHAGCMERS